MEILVRFEQRIPPTMDPGEVARLLAAEQERARELRAAGHAKRVWELPGRAELLVLFEFDSLDAFHATVTSLPMFRYGRVLFVEPLATSWIEREAPAQPG